MIAWGLLTRMLGSGKIVKMIQISNPFWHFSGKFSAIILSERRLKNIAQLLNITSFSAQLFVLSVPFSVWVLFTPFPWMSVSFLKLSGIISAVSGDTGVSILSPPRLASDKHFLPRTSLSSNVPVLSSTRWSTNSHQTDSNHGHLFYEHSWCHKFPDKFQISCWPLTTALCPAERNFLDGEKLSQTTNNCCSSEFCIKNNKNVSLRLSSLKIMITRGEGHAPGTGGEGLMTALACEGRCLMSWWRLIMADHISVWSPVAWSGPGLACSDLSRIMSYETQHSQLSR